MLTELKNCSKDFASPIAFGESTCAKKRESKKFDKKESAGDSLNADLKDTGGTNKCTR